jgi:type II secretory pathway component GspD/PulD (secretin)
MLGFRIICFTLASATLASAVAWNAGPAASAPRVVPSPVAPSVIGVTVVPAERVAAVLRSIYPHATIRVERAANAIVVVAPPDVVAGMRAIVTGIDTKSPTDATVEAVQLHSASPEVVISRIRGTFPHARLTAAPNRTIVVSAVPNDMAQIKAVIGAIDTPPPAPTPRPVYAPVAVRVVDGNAKAIARAVAHAVPTVRVAVSGPQVVLTGPPDDVAHAKDLAGELDQPAPDVQYTNVYRLRFVDATSVAQLLARSFHGLDLQVDKDLNAITALATTSLQERIAGAIAQLDAAPTGAPGPGGQPAEAGGVPGTEVITLKAAVPGIGGAASTSASDIAQTVGTALSGAAPDLKITVHPNSTRLVLTGSPYSLALAKNLIAQLDVAEPLVVLDTEVLEVDENVQKQLGFKFPTAALSTTYSELTPAASASGAAAQLLSLQPLTRTPLTLGAQLDFLITTNKARILEDPRITTFSGRTASLRAGETVNILTTTGGGTGTVATTQVQSFQTGVTLDITPVVNSDDYVTVSLHPSVNTEAGISSAGVPNIQTRDTTTTVGLHDGETIVVGGLIEDTNTRNVQKIPFLGDLPLIGRFFQDVNVNNTRNELIVTVTPHIVKPGTNADFGGSSLGVPTPGPLPTLEPRATLPPVSKAPRPRRTPIVVENTPLPEANATAAPTPAGSATPIAGASAKTPLPVPSAFGATNVFTFGKAPANNYVDPSQPPQIFFVQAQPSVIRDGQALTISAITSTNVSSLTFGVSQASSQASLARIGAGQWQSTFNFSVAGLPVSSGNVTLLLVATTQQGGTATVRIPFSVLPSQ